MRLIALAGRAGCGKNTAARLLGGAEVSFADPLKQICRDVFGFSEAQLYGPSAERNRPDPRWDGLTPRHALQTLGTEWGRACHPDVWARAGVRKALEIGARIAGEGSYRNPSRPLVVITDCRFVNEAKAVRAAGGEVWRITRRWFGLEGAAAQHPSELEQEAPEFLELVNRTIVNDGTLAELAQALR